TPWYLKSARSAARPTPLAWTASRSAAPGTRRVAGSDGSQPVVTGVFQQPPARLHQALLQAVGFMGFIVTNLTLPSRAVVRFYNKRGTSEQWIQEDKQAAKMTRLSCHGFRPNEVGLWLSVI